MTYFVECRQIGTGKRIVYRMTNGGPPVLATPDEIQRLDAHKPLHAGRTDMVRLFANRMLDLGQMRCVDARQHPQYFVRTDDDGMPYVSSVVVLENLPR